MSTDDQHELEQIFATSWDEAEQFYRFLVTIKAWENLTPIFGLIAEIRQ